jgi:DNA invertase Pin-like site-specific DNA recombinase
MFNWILNSLVNNNRINTESNDTNTSIQSLSEFASIINNFLRLYNQNPIEINNLINVISNLNSNQQLNNTVINRDNTVVNTDNNTVVNSSKKRSNSEADGSIELCEFMEISNKKQYSTNLNEKEKVNNRKKIEKTIIWTRISTKNQESGTSLDDQEKECKNYIKSKGNYFPSDSFSLRMIGSGYSLSGSVKENFDLIDSYLNDNYKIHIVCYMPDRFLRSKSKALEFIKKCNSKGGSVHFVKSVDNNPLNSNIDLDMKKIEECMNVAESESRIKSTRIKDSFESRLDTLLIKSMDDEECKKIRKFITAFLNGDKIDSINKYFIDLVKWHLYPEWGNDCKTTPIHYDPILLINKKDTSVQYLKKCGSEVDKFNRIHSIIHLFKDYKIPIPSLFKNRKRWDALFIKKIMIDHVDDISNKLKEQL